MKIPKNNEAKTFTIKISLKEKVLSFNDICFINMLTINPKVLPARI